MGVIVFWIGIGSLALQAYALTGRPPDLALMRGIGPLTLLIVVLGGAGFGAAVLLGRRRLGRVERLATRVAAGAILVALAGTLILLRHPLTGAPEFPHHDSELAATRLLLAAAGGLFIILWRWRTLSDVVTECRANGWSLATGLPRLGARALWAWRGAVANLALTVAAIALTTLFCEAAIRIVQGVPVFSKQNLIAQDNDLLRGQAANVYDPTLGWVLADNQLAGPDGGFATGRYGVRMNGHVIAPVPHEAIVATGDSFTAGSEVSNWESWPAQLEGLLGKPVVNAAAGAWGADQIVLRAESLIPLLRPTAIVVSFLADDIARAGFRTYGGGNKPFFTVRDGALEAHNIPVPHFTGRANEIGWLRSVLGYSQLVATIMQATGKYDWWLGRGYSPVDTDVAQVSCLLLKQLKAKTDSAEIALYFVMQYGGSHIVELPDQPSYAKTVLGCAENLEIPTINTWKPLLDARQRDPAGFKSLFVMHNEGTVYGHMSATGNALVAQLVAERIRQSAKH